MAKKMLVDATHPEETRVVVVDGNKVDDFDFESINKRQLAGNIYLAKVTRVEPSLQAAFVEYGGNRHGFLAFSEIHPDYYQIPMADREALLEEERREEEARRAREEDGDAQDGRARGKRGRRSRKSGRDRNGDDDANGVAGLEVIDIDDDDDDDQDEAGDGVPRGLEIAEPDVVANDQPSAGPLQSVDPVGTAGAAGDAADDRAEVTGPDDADSDGSGADETSADAAGPRGSGTGGDDPDGSDADGDAEDPDGAGRTIAEAAGLDDDERVVGDADGGRAQTVTGGADGGDTLSAGGADEDLPDDDATAADARATPDADTRGDDDDDGGGDEDADEDETAEDGTPDDEAAEASDDGQSGRRPRRRRGRGRRGGRDGAAGDAAAAAPDRKNGDTAAETDEEGPDEPEAVGAEDTLEEAARARTRLRRKYKIQDVVKVRQILLVQVVKEERGNKGAALTTYLSLAGRYCVLMPNTARGGGISRKITNAGDRKRLREITGEMEVPQGMGLIVRTAGAERTKAEIKRDYEFLLRQWEQIRDLTLKSIAPTLIYEEGSLIKRSIRDIYNKDIEQILVAGEQGYREAKEYMKMLMPSHAKNVQPYTDPIPLFSRYQVESYLNGMFNPTVQLKSGGYIVIGVTEALVAIDVNSGRATKQGSIEETALQTNLEAAEEVARQLRLRDLAGLIVIDFIDMDENRNNRAVEKRMKDRLKTDRARIQVGRISAFGLMEMSRQRLRPGMLEATTQPCPACHGTGLIRSDESLTLSILRELEEEGLRGRAGELVLRVPVDISNYLVNSKRQHLAQIEERHGIAILIVADPSLVSPQFEIERSKAARPRPARQTDVVTAASVVEDDDLVEDAADEVVEERDDDDDGAKGRRRGRRGGRRRRGDDKPDAESEDDAEAASDEDEDTRKDGDDDGRPKRRRSRRRGGRGRGRDRDETQATADDGTTDAASRDAAVAAAAPQPAAQPEEPPAPAVEIFETVETVDVAAIPPERQTEAGTATEEDDPDEVPGVAAGPSDDEGAAAAGDTVTGGDVTGGDGIGDVAETAAVEPVAAAAAEPEPDDPSRPKRRGWWSFSR